MREGVSERGNEGVSTKVREGGSEGGREGVRSERVSEGVRK